MWRRNSTDSAVLFCLTLTRYSTVKYVQLHTNHRYINIYSPSGIHINICTHVVQWNNQEARKGIITTAFLTVVMFLGCRVMQSQLLKVPIVCKVLLWFTKLVFSVWDGKRVQERGYGARAESRRVPGLRPGGYVLTGWAEQPGVFHVDPAELGDQGRKRFILAS